MSRVWANIAMLGGVRGALSIALAATITTSAVISQTDLHTINTMVFGVAFISIMIQVPLLIRYVKRQKPDSDAFKETEIDEQFAEISKSIEEVNLLKSEGKISDQEFSDILKEKRKEIDLLMTESHATLATRKIIQARASILFQSLQKRSKRRQKLGETNKESGSEKKTDSS
jgi:NhaP-type Na+/H+ or K+/H+ antiporter